jgi:hypothetical protein
MSSRTSSPPTHEVLASDRATLAALKDLPAYDPRDPAHSVATMVALDDTLTQTEIALSRARLAFDAAKAEHNKASWALHDSVVGARAEVKVQFGPESHEVHAIGLKRNSERKRPTRRAKAEVL